MYLSVISSGIFIATNNVGTLEWPLFRRQCGEVYWLSTGSITNETSQWASLEHLVKYGGGPGGVIF